MVLRLIMPNQNKLPVDRPTEASARRASLVSEETRLRKEKRKQNSASHVADKRLSRQSAVQGSTCAVKAGTKTQAKGPPVHGSTRPKSTQEMCVGSSGKVKNPPAVWAEADSQSATAGRLQHYYSPLKYQSDSDTQRLAKDHSLSDVNQTRHGDQNNEVDIAERTNEINLNDEKERQTPKAERERKGAKPKQKPAVEKADDVGEKYHYELDDRDIGSHDYTNLNLQFYRNELSYKPWGFKIEEVLTWKGDYRRLESNHSYIQWLFPTDEPSRINTYSRPIGFEEAEAIRDDPVLRERFLRAYVMMLEFYGMKLESEKTGDLCRSPNYRERLDHLNGSSHNHFRITRILTALGIYGYRHFQKPCLLFILTEKFKERSLANIPKKVLLRWIDTVVEMEDKEELMRQFTSYAESPNRQNSSRL